MEILQPVWRGRNLSSRKDGRGNKFVAMTGQDAILYVPISAQPNKVYRITLELHRESGNGTLFCNIYGNSKYDFPQVKLECQEAKSKWCSYMLNVETKDFPNTLPLTFRIWRGKKSTGTIFVKRIQIELSDVIDVEAPKLLSTTLSGNLLEKVEPEFPRKTRLRRSAERRNRSKANGKFANIECFKHHEKVPGATKVLYLPANSLQIVQTGMYDAFKNNGFELYTFDFRNYHANNRSGIGEALLKVCREFEPDWIHMQLQFTCMIPAQYVRAVKDILPNVIISNWTGDIRYEANNYFVEIGKHVDLPLISSKGQLSLYKNAGLPHVEYWQIGVDPKYFHPMTNSERDNLHSRYGHDVVFCAVKSSHFPDSHLRYKIVQSLHKAFGKRFAIYGNGWGRFSSARGPVGYYAQNDVYNGSKIAINVNHFNSVEMYFSDRQLITMASGTPVVCNYIPGLERYFQNSREVAWFNSLEECVDLVRYYINHSDEAEKMGKAGAKKVIEQHSYTARVKELAMRLGFVKSSQDSIDSSREVRYTNGDHVKVLGVVPNSSDKRFRFRSTNGKIEFQGVLLSDRVECIVAEFQPDLVHFYVYNYEQIGELVKKIRGMTEAPISCFFDNLNVGAIEKLKSFDYVISNAVPDELNNYQKPKVIEMSSDVLLKDKGIGDIIEEVLFIM